jgi:quercetin dioxygenase-like cupin family protein
MTIPNLLQQLETAQFPVAKAIHHGTGFKVLALGFKRGMKMKEHVAHLPSRLTILSGQIIYRENEKELTLNIWEETEIPVNVVHSLEATEDSLCLLTQG